ncbi:DUF4115 domain-containing protein, partial [Roseomonas sp. GC11]|uniref:DUF4115 domain-containing protein n=1 Tax=Roseomonas sp. GC11 TaxID=2950546 RepID=UPI00210C8A28
AGRPAQGGAPATATPPAAGQNAQGQNAQGQNAQGQNTTGQNATARPGAVPPAAAPGATPGATPAPPSASAANGAAPPPAATPAPAAEGHGIVLRAVQDAWVQVRDSRSGRVLLNRVLRPGETYDVPQGPGLVLSTGKAEGLAIEVDGVATRALADQVGVKRDIPLDAARLREAGAR